MIRHDIISLRCGGLFLFVSLNALAPLSAQVTRDSLVNAARAELDQTSKIRLLVAALDPALGPPRDSWDAGVQLLAQNLIDNAQDSIAAIWLRWAIRLAPDLQPDTIQFVPRLPVLAAYRSAHEFVSRTKVSDDTLTVTSWRWAPYGSGQGFGRIQVPTRAGVPIQVSVADAGMVLSGASASLAPGSYPMRASAVGYDSARVVREVLPQIATVVDFRLRRAPVAPPPAAPPAPISVAPKKKGFPWLWAGLGAGGAGVLAVLLLRHTPSPPTTGGIIINIP